MIGSYQIVWHLIDFWVNFDLRSFEFWTGHTLNQFFVLLFSLFGAATFRLCRSRRRCGGRTRPPVRPVARNRLQLVARLSLLGRPGHRPDVPVQIHHRVKKLRLRYSIAYLIDVPQLLWNPRKEESLVNGATPCFEKVIFNQ